MFGSTHYIKNCTCSKYPSTQSIFWWTELNVHLSKLPTVHGLDMNIWLATDRLENTTEAAQRNKGSILGGVCLHQEHVYRLLCSFISTTFATSPAPLIIPTQRDFPCCFTMAFPFQKTQLTETLKVYLLSENCLVQISTDSFYHQSITALSHSFCCVFRVWATHHADKSMGFTTFSSCWICQAITW